MRFVGDLSKADAELLARYAAKSSVGVLEFGAGGSTQIIAQKIRPDVPFVTVETQSKWSRVTRGRLQRLGVSERCRIVAYEEWEQIVPTESRFDVVFVDGLRNLRLPFALKAWSLLTTSGVVIFHDTRRRKDAADALSLAAQHFEEVSEVRLNEPVRGRSSNMTVVVRKKLEGYVNWQKTEGLPSWRYGARNVPPGFWRPAKRE